MYTSCNIILFFKSAINTLTVQYAPEYHSLSVYRVCQRSDVEALNSGILWCSWEVIESWLYTAYLKKAGSLEHTAEGIWDSRPSSSSVLRLSLCKDVLWVTATMCYSPGGPRTTLSTDYEVKSEMLSQSKSFYLLIGFFSGIPQQKGNLTQMFVWQLLECRVQVPFVWPENMTEHIILIFANSDSSWSSIFQHHLIKCPVSVLPSN